MVLFDARSTPRTERSSRCCHSCTGWTFLRFPALARGSLRLRLARVRLRLRLRVCSRPLATVQRISLSRSTASHSFQLFFRTLSLCSPPFDPLFRLPPPAYPPRRTHTSPVLPNPTRTQETTRTILTFPSHAHDPDQPSARSIIASLSPLLLLSSLTHTTAEMSPSYAQATSAWLPSDPPQPDKALLSTTTTHEAGNHSASTIVQGNENAKVQVVGELTPPLTPPGEKEDSIAAGEGVRRRKVGKSSEDEEHDVPGKGFVQSIEGTVSAERYVPEDLDKRIYKPCASSLSSLPREFLGELMVGTQGFRARTSLRRRSIRTARPRAGTRRSTRTSPFSLSTSLSSTRCDPFHPP